MEKEQEKGKEGIAGFERRTTAKERPTVHEDNALIWRLPGVKPEHMHASHTTLHRSLKQLILPPALIQMHEPFWPTAALGSMLSNAVQYL